MYINLVIDKYKFYIFADFSFWYFLSAFLPVKGTNDKDFLWIDLVKDKTWRHNDQVAEQYFWNPGEPNPLGFLEACTIMETAGKWGDVLCDRSHGFVCEMENK